MLVLVASVKSYSDAWGPFITLFNRFWSDCPYRKVLFSDQLATLPIVADFNFVDLKHDNGWIPNLLEVLNFSNFDTVMLFQEDFFLCYPVNQERITGIENWFRESPFAACWLCPLGYSEGPEVYPDITAIPLSAEYRASCQVAIWKREKLIELCNRLLTAGRRTTSDYELYGSRLIDDFKLCGWIRKDNAHHRTWPMAYQCTAIMRGKWMEGAVRFCMSEGIPLNLKRGVAFDEGTDPELFLQNYDEWRRSLD